MSKHLHCHECNAPDARMTTFGVLCVRCSNPRPYENDCTECPGVPLDDDGQCPCCGPMPVSDITEGDV